jgi:hypothetical protein
MTILERAANLLAGNAFKHVLEPGGPVVEEVEGREVCGTCWQYTRNKEKGQIWRGRRTYLLAVHNERGKGTNMERAAYLLASSTRGTKGMGQIWKRRRIYLLAAHKGQGKGTNMERAAYLLAGAAFEHAGSGRACSWKG